MSPLIYVLNLPKGSGFGKYQQRLEIYDSTTGCVCLVKSSQGSLIHIDGLEKVEVMNDVGNTVTCAGKQVLVTYVL